MRVKIVSDGTARGTGVYDMDGNMLEGVVSVEWGIGLREEDSRCRIELVRVPVQLDTDADVEEREP